MTTKKNGKEKETEANGDSEWCGQDEDNKKHEKKKVISSKKRKSEKGAWNIYGKKMFMGRFK